MTVYKIPRRSGGKTGKKAKNRRNRLRYGGKEARTLRKEGPDISGSYPHIMENDLEKCSVADIILLSAVRSAGLRRETRSKNDEKGRLP